MSGRVLRSAALSGVLALVTTTIACGTRTTEDTVSIDSQIDRLERAILARYDESARQRVEALSSALSVSDREYLVNMRVASASADSLITDPAVARALDLLAPTTALTRSIRPLYPPAPPPRPGTIPRREAAETFFDYAKRRIRQCFPDDDVVSTAGDLGLVEAVLSGVAELSPERGKYAPGELTPIDVATWYCAIEFGTNGTTTSCAFAAFCLRREVTFFPDGRSETRCLDAPGIRLDPHNVCIAPDAGPPANSTSSGTPVCDCFDYQAVFSFCTNLPPNHVQCTSGSPPAGCVPSDKNTIFCCPIAVGACR